MCHEILKASEGLVHTTCQKKLRYVKEPTCFKCGKTVMRSDEEYCSDCRKRKHYFDRGHAVWVYDTLMQKSIIRYKYHGAKCYADFYVPQMIETQGQWLREIAPDVLIPVPVHWRKKNQRGYNQAELLARKLGKCLQCPVDTKYLVRSQWTRPQKALTPTERYINLKKAFKVKSRQYTYNTVLLVDDIYTTGSTIDACASVLKSAGVQKVYFLSLCIGSDDGG